MKIRYKNGISKGKNDKLCEGFEELQKYHTTTHKRSFQFLKKWIKDRSIIYKDHILPTKEHIEYINKINYPVVILLRDPFDTFDNYKRLLDDYRTDKLSKAEINELHLDVLHNIDMVKFTSDIIDYRNFWIEAKIKKALYIDYNELVMCPYHTCKKIVQHFGFNMPKVKKFALLKAKGNHGYNTYTGVGFERAKKQWSNK